LYPEGLASDVLARLQQLTSNSENETQKRLEQERAAHPDGTHDDPLGLRVRYTISFSEDGYYHASPDVSPAFRNFDWRGVVNLCLLDARLEPEPPTDAAGSSHLQRLSLVGCEPFLSQRFPSCEFFLVPSANGKFV
jgi:hypothetical protein